MSSPEISSRNAHLLREDIKRVYLTGYMGAGKSTIGKRLAEALRFRFVDTDRYIVKQLQKSISRIFQEEGEPYFREVEERVLGELSVPPGWVISTGGGTLTREATCQIAEAYGPVVYLKAPVEVLYERVIFSRKDRPILNEPDTERVFVERFQEREPFYERSAVVVVTHQKTPYAVVQEIMEKLTLLPEFKPPMPTNEALSVKEDFSEPEQNPL